MQNQAPYDYNRVTKFTPQEPKFKDWDNKPKIETIVFIAPNPSLISIDRYICAVEVRICGTDAVTYCNLWAHTRDCRIFTRGQGKASGYGYHRESAAINDAATSAGFEFERDFDGCGDNPINHAIRAIAKKLGWNTGQVMRF